MSCKFEIAVFVGMNRDWCQFKVHPDTVTITQSNLFAGFNSSQKMHQDQDVLYCNVYCIVLYFDMYQMVIIMFEQSDTTKYITDVHDKVLRHPFLCHFRHFIVTKYFDTPTFVVTAYLPFSVLPCTVKYETFIH